MIQSDSLGVTAQTPEGRKRPLQSVPLMCGLPKENHTNEVHLPTLSSLSEGKNGKNYRHCTAQNPHSSTQTRPCQQQDITSSVSSQRGLSAGKTDEEILANIRAKLKMFKAQMLNGHKNKNKRLTSNHRDSLKSSSKSDTSAHSTSFNSEEGQGLDCGVTEHYSSTLWPRCEVDSSEGSKATPEFAVKSDETDSCATSAPEQHSTEYPQIMQRVTGSHRKIEDKVPVLLTILSGTTMDELAENHPGSTLNCSSPEKEYKTPWLNTNSSFDNVDRIPGASLSRMSWKKRRTVPKATEVGQIDCVEDQSMNPSFNSSTSGAFQVVIEDVKTDKLKNTEEHQLIQHTEYKFESQAVKLQIHDIKAHLEQSSKENNNQNHLEGEQHTVCLSHALFESKAGQQEPLPESKVKVFCKNPNYEDISDEDQSCMVTQVTKTKHGGSDILTGCRDPQYEDISEDDNSQNRNFDLEIQKAEPNSVQSPLENVGSRHTQGQTDVKADYISIENHAPELPYKGQKCFCPYYVETEHGFESTLCPKCERDLEQQKEQLIVCSSLSDQENEDSDGQNSDSDSYDDFIVIPLTASNLRFESEDQIPDNKEIVVLSDDEISETEGEGRQAGSCSTHYDLHHPVSIPQPANNIEVYGTLESYLREKNLDHLAGNINVSDGIISESELCSRESMLHPTVTSETEGSSETDDSCNYSSDPKRNYLTVSNSLLMKMLSPGSVEADDSLSAAEDELKEDMNVHTSKTIACPTSKVGLAAKSPLMQKLGKLINSKSSRKRNRLKANKQRISKQNDIIDSDSENESDQNYRTMKKILSSRYEATNTQHHEHPPEVVNSQIFHAQIEDAMSNDSCDQTNTTDKTRHLVETNASRKHVSHKTKRCTVLVKKCTDSADRGDHNFKNVQRKSSSSELRKNGESQRHSLEMIYIQSKTLTENVKKSIQSSANLSQAQNDLQLGDRTENAHSDLSNGRHRIKTNINSTHRRKTSEDKGLLLNSEPKRHSAETVNQLCGAGRKPSETSAEKSQSVAKGPVSKLFFKESKKTKLDYIDKSQKGKSVPKPHLPKDKQHESLNTDLASKAKQFSRQRSVPNHASTSKNNYESGNRLAYFSRGLSCDAQISVSPNELTFEQTPAITKQHSTLEQSHYSSVACHQGKHPGSVSPPTMQTSAKKQVTKNWNDSYFPTRRDKKNLEAEECTTSNSMLVKNASGKLYQESSTEARPGPSHERVRHRNNSHENDPPLMKRAKVDFRKLQEGRIRDPSTEQSVNVGKGYKWKEKPPAAKLQKVKATNPHR